MQINPFYHRKPAENVFLTKLVFSNFELARAGNISLIFIFPFRAFSMPSRHSYGMEHLAAIPKHGFCVPLKVCMPRSCFVERVKGVHSLRTLGNPSF